MPFPNDVVKLSELIADKITGGVIEGSKIIAATIEGGSAFIEGAIEAATITASEFVGGIVTGAVIRTAEAGRRWEIQSGNGANQIAGYTNDPNETFPALFEVSTKAGSPALVLQGPAKNGLAAALEFLGNQLTINAVGGTFFTGGGVSFSGSSIGIDHFQFGTVDITIPAGSRSTFVSVFHGIGSQATAVFASAIGTAPGVNGKCASLGNGNVFQINADRESTSGALTVTVCYLAIW